MVFCIGRRNHNLSRLDDLENPVSRGYAEKTCAELGATLENMDAVVDSIIKRFI